MALLHVDYHSRVLRCDMQMDVILPEQTRGQIGMQGRGGSEKWKTLYLLHGMSDDHTIWQRRTSIERYAAEKGIAVVMPTTHLGWYTDMATAQDIQRIRNERREARRIPTERVLGTAFKSIALRWVRKQPRMKTTKLEDITKVARYISRDGSTGFKIEAKGKTFTLHS